MAISKNLIILFGIVFALLACISSHAAPASTEYGTRKEILGRKDLGNDKDKPFCDGSNLYSRCIKKKPIKRRPCTYKNHCRSVPPLASP